LVLQEQLKEIDQWRKRVTGNKPALSLNAYTGVYSNALYGTLNISQKSSQLFIQFHTKPDLTATLSYMDNGEWLMEYNNIEYGIFSIKFEIAANKVKSVTTKQNEYVEYNPYTFIKK
jgi:hypothetical protein